MFVSGCYKSLLKHVTLYESLEASMEQANTDEFIAKKDKSRKRRRDDQDPLPPSPPDLDLSKKKRHDYDASGSKQPPAPQIGKKKLSKSDLEGPAFKVVKAFHENIISLQFQMEDCHRLLTDQVDLVNSEGHQLVLDPTVLLIGGLSKRNSTSLDTVPPSDHRVVKSYMRILSVISIKTFERYGYTFLREIVIRRADYNEYKISKVDFKNLHMNEFEDLYLLHLQGKLNHLPGSDKVHLYNAINLWIRNIVIRQRMGDLQLSIESYQTKLNLTEPRWITSDFLFKEDYTIVSKLQAVIYRDRNDQKKMLRENEVHKFSDGTLTRVLHKLDHMVKDFRLYQYNPGIEYRIWFEDDKRRSEEFMELIKRRLKIRRIF
nr:hypothetical protein [Tanacetum cinerariifolium]